MTQLIPASNTSSGGVTLAQVNAAIASHLLTDPHLTQAQIQLLIDASVDSAIANLMIPTYGNNFQGIRDDNTTPVAGAGFTDVLTHTVTSVNNGAWHSVIASYHMGKSAMEDVRAQVTLNGVPLDIEMRKRTAGDAGSQSESFAMHFNAQLSAGDVLVLQAAENAGGSARIENMKLFLFESAQLDVAAAPPAFNVSTPASRFVTTFWNQMAGDPNGTASTTIVPSVSGGVGPFTYAWSISNVTGVGSPPPSLASATSVNGTVSATTVAVSYIRNFDVTVTVTDTGTGLTDSSTTAVNFNISETSN